MIKRTACVLAVVLVIAGPTTAKKQELSSADVRIGPEIKAMHLQATHLEISSTPSVGIFTF